MSEKQAASYGTDFDLKNIIKSGSLSGVYLLFGDEQYLVRKYVNDIVSASVELNPDFNISRFDSGAKMQAVYDAVSSFPMMSPKKAVTLCDFPFDKLSSAECDKLLSAIEDCPDTTVFVIWFETVDINPKKPGDKWQKLFKAVQSSGGSVFNICRKTEAELVKMLQQGAARRHRRLDVSAARYMIETCSDDLGTLINELEKLCLYTEADGSITAATVDKVCSRSTEASVYNVSKAILRGDAKEAYRLLDDLMYMNTDPVYILTFMASAYIDIYRCFSARRSGKNNSDIAKDFNYRSTAFRLDEASRRAAKFTESQIKRSLTCLAECDRAVKGSRCDGRVQLEKAVAELILIAKKG